MSTLDVSSLLPLYQQVMDDLKAKIEDGSYPAGRRIPSETELSEAYGVSRITVRHAVQELCEEGYLAKRQGKGTFVEESKLRRKIVQVNDVESFTRVCQSADLVPGAAPVGLTVGRPSERMATFLGLPDDAEVIVAERLRTADGVPIMLEHNVFPREGFEFLLDEDMSDVSIFDVLERHTGRRPERTRYWSIDIVRAEPDVAELLEVPAGEPLFLEYVEFEDANGRPLLAGRQKIVGSRFTFSF